MISSAAEQPIRKELSLYSLNFSDTKGGAARAVYRIHKSLVANESQLQVKSKLMVREKQTREASVIDIGTQKFIARRKAGSALTAILKIGFSSENYNLRTFAWPSSGIVRKLNDDFDRGLVDLVQLNWLGFGTISIEEIGRLRMPLVWCLQDQWPFLGSEHYDLPPNLETGSFSIGPRYLSGYTKDNRPLGDKGLDLDRWVWQRKNRAWKEKSIHLIAPSTWMANCIKASKLMGSWPVSVIPAPIDTDFWCPGSQLEARIKLGLPRESRCVLLTSEGGLTKPRKGGLLLLEALNEFNSRQIRDEDRVSLVVTGEKVKNHYLSATTEIMFVGKVSDDLELKTLYRAADIVAIPSLQDNFPNTGLEAHACGKPVIGFDIGGLPDIVAEKQTGVLTPPFDSKQLAEGISWLFGNSERLKQLGINARSRAVNLWNPLTVATQFRQTYDAILSKCK